MKNAFEYESELAALREELADRCEVIAMKGREVIEAQTAVTSWAAKCKAAEQRNAELRQELAVLHAIKETPGENVLWDVLNATVGIITRRAYPHALESEAHNAGAKVILDRRAGLAATHLKPTESGETE